MDNINALLNLWHQRAQNPIYDDSYKEAVSECAFELENAAITDSELLDNPPEDDMTDYFLQQEAEYYLSTWRHTNL